jgi:hypothetical protein
MTDHKTRFQQIRENNLTERAGVYDPGAAHYPTPSHTRNVCFVWPDGARLFLNYSYLVAGHYLPDDNCIYLTFTTHKIGIKGLRLEGLYLELMDQSPRIITCTDERYKALADKDAPVVSEMTVTDLE